MVCSKSNIRIYIMWQKMRNSLGPLLLILLCPPFVMLMWYTNTQLGGSLGDLWDLMIQQGFLQTTYDIWKPYFWGSTTAWFIVFCFIVSSVFASLSFRNTGTTSYLLFSIANFSFSHFAMLLNVNPAE